MKHEEINAAIDQLMRAEGVLVMAAQGQEVKSGLQHINVALRKLQEFNSRLAGCPQVPSGRPFGHYFKDVRHLDGVDVYRVLSLFEVTDPALQHAVKKLLCTGKRGAKDQETDLKEAIASVERALEMRKEDSQ